MLSRWDVRVYSDAWAQPQPSNCDQDMLSSADCDNIWNVVYTKHADSSPIAVTSTMALHGGSSRVMLSSFHEQVFSHECYFQLLVESVLFWTITLSATFRRWYCFELLCFWLHVKRLADAFSQQQKRHDMTCLVRSSYLRRRALPFFCWPLALVFTHSSSEAMLRCKLSCCLFSVCTAREKVSRS